LLFFPLAKAGVEQLSPSFFFSLFPSRHTCKTIFVFFLQIALPRSSPFIHHIQGEKGPYLLSPFPLRACRKSGFFQRSRYPPLFFLDQEKNQERPTSLFLSFFFPLGEEDNDEDGLFLSFFLGPRAVFFFFFFMTAGVLFLSPLFLL